MNTLSLLIYFAGIVGNLGYFLTLVTVLLIVATIGSIIIWCIYHDETDSAWRPYVGDALIERRKVREQWRKRVLNFALLAVFVGTINAIIPSRQTVLLIAASEMGEKILSNEKVGQVIDPSIDLITTWMKNETTEIKKKMDQK